MTSSQSTQDMGFAPPMEQVLQMLAKLQDQIQDLTNQVSTTQQLVANSNEQSKQDRVLWMANHDKLTALSEDYGQLAGEFIETKGLV
ncbi:hypothetical protein ACLB2K_036975 [Fragaria x ananassa]